MTQPMIHITNLRKAYGDFLAVDDISQRRGHPALAFLALIPYILGILFL